MSLALFIAIFLLAASAHPYLALVVGFIAVVEHW